MKDYIHLYEHPTTEDYNDEFLRSENDYSFEELVVCIMKEYEAIENITLDKYEVINDMDEINMNEHRININYKKKKQNDPIPNFKHIYEDICTEMKFYFTVRTNLEERKIVKSILLPKPMDGFFLMNNKRAKAIWQLVEASVYTQRGRITLKSRMPLTLYKQANRPMTDIDGNPYTFKQYSIAMDSSKKRRGPKARVGKQKNKFLNPLLVLSAKVGIYDTIAFFGVKDAITIVQTVRESAKEKYYYFPLDELFIKVSKELFDNNEFIQSMTGMLYHLSNRDHPVTWENVYDKNYWICRLGLVGSIAKDKSLTAFKEKGKTTLLMFERHLKELTIRSLRLPEAHKENIYCVLRWMMMDYDELKAKDNIDVTTKRIRKNEYIVDSTLGRKISEMINSLISKLSDSRQNDIDSLLELFNYSSCIILNGMRNLSDLIKPDDVVNDCTMLLDLAYSTKGPEALGEKSTKNVILKMRDIHPSFVGIIDPNCTSNSDIGMSGSFTPFVNIYDRFYFTPTWEPSHMMYDTYKDVKTWKDVIGESVYTEEDIQPVDINTGEVIDISSDAKWNIELPYDNKEHFDEALKAYNDLFDIANETIEIIEKVPEARKSYPQVNIDLK